MIDTSKLSFPPATHRNDPETSRDAERAHTESGAREIHMNIVHGIVRTRPGLTARELEKFAPFDLQEVRRRLTDLKAIGKVRMGEARRIEGRSRAERTWWLS